LQQVHLYVGTQCEEAGRGIYELWFDEVGGVFSEPRLAAAAERPTWVLRHPQRNVLYAVSEIGNRDARQGRLQAFTIGGDGGLEPLDEIGAGGGGPTHLTIHPDGSTLFAANFGGGQAVCVPLQPDGRFIARLSVRQQEGSGPHRRQTKAHPHGVTLDPAGRFLLVPDMGADRIFVYRYSPGSGELDNGSPAVELPAGSGPRLAAFGITGRFVYLLTELSAELFVFAWNPEAGRLDSVQSLALDREDGEGEPSAAALVLSKDGRFLYASNRRLHAIQAYEIDGEAGRLAFVQSVPSGGERPWAAEITPSGDWLLAANQASDTVAAFRRDPQTGLLSPQPGASVTVQTPTCIEFSGLRR
jgi:6-phosphogluconolactonase